MPQTQGYTDAPLTADQVKAAGFVDVPRGSERTRPDTNILGVNHEQLQQSIANWASTLSPKWQKPAAILATFPADVLASLVEMVSAPESIAGGTAAAGGMKAIDAVGDAAKTVATKVPTTAIRATAAVGDVVHPDVIGAISPRAGKVVNIAQRLRDKLPSAEAPGSATASVAAPQTPKPRFTLEEWRAAQDLVKEGYSEPDVLAAIERHRQAPPTSATVKPFNGPPLGKAWNAVYTEITKQGIKPSDLEVSQGLKWLKDGVPEAEVAQRIVASRQMSAKFKLPTPEAVRRTVAERNDSGRWPE